MEKSAVASATIRRPRSVLTQKFQSCISLCIAYFPELTQISLVITLGIC